MNAKAVIFDVDGVLVDSYRAHFESWVQLFAELGYQRTEEQFRATFGRTSSEILEEWSREQGLEFSEQRIRTLDDRKEALYRQVMRAHFTPVDGATELIDALHADGFLLAVGSSGPPENVQLVIEQLQRAAKFSAIVSRADVERGKPDPQIFLVAAQRLGVPPSECAVIEDAVPGIEAANRAGMMSVGLLGTTTRQRLAAADLVVESLRELSPSRIADVLSGRTR